ncbi:hypothetical protein J2805_003769 [Arthrobacter oryzae]|nr:hypothetical protein [Arthrobacter oryzae]
MTCVLLSRASPAKECGWSSSKKTLVFTGEDSPMANLMLSVMGAFAEFERSRIRERQREGIALAKRRGAYKGRKKTLTPERARPSWSSAPVKVFRKLLLPVTTGSAGRLFTSTCATPSWSEPLPCLSRRCAIVRAAVA